ncbi:MFS transporter, partial [Anaeromyxobacter sp. PSR-1]|uniref:MFS transporter n=1 Tax=Anaeromyxobacter sp. PSR-1 TaxID=1300915 RepID=UPI000AEBFE58
MPRSTAARTAPAIASPPASAAPGPTRSLVAAMAIAVGVPAGSLYLAQPLVGSIGPALGMSPGWAGAAVTATFLGYALGLVLLVPLGDVLENRSLALRLLGANAVAAAAAAAAPGPATFLAAALLLGASCSVIQVLVALAAHLAPPERRGRVVGDVMSGLMLGILLARPISSVVAGAWGWRTVYAAWAALALGAGLPLWRRLPRWRGPAGPGYVALLRSLGALAAGEPVLRRRALGSALSMA